MKRFTGYYAEPYKVVGARLLGSAKTYLQSEAKTIAEMLQIPGVIDYGIESHNRLFLLWDDTLDTKEIDLRWNLFMLGYDELLEEVVRRYDARN